MYTYIYVNVCIRYARNGRHGGSRSTKDTCGRKRAFNNFTTRKLRKNSKNRELLINFTTSERELSFESTFNFALLSGH